MTQHTLFNAQEMTGQSIQSRTGRSPLRWLLALVITAVLATACGTQEYEQSAYVVSPVEQRLENGFGLVIENGTWTEEELLEVESAVGQLQNAFAEAGVTNPTKAFTELWQGTHLNRVRSHNPGGNALTHSRSRIDFYDGTFFDTFMRVDGTIEHPVRASANAQATIIHELGHVWDRRHNRRPSTGLAELVGGEYDGLNLPWGGGFGTYTVEDASPQAGHPHDPSGHNEDWAYTLAAYVTDAGSLSAARVTFVAGQMAGLEGLVS